MDVASDVNPTAGSIASASSRGRVLGHIEPYNPETPWQIYIARMEEYFWVNGIIDDREKKGVFFTLAGPYACEVLWRICTPVEPTSKSFVEICAALKQHFVKPTIEIGERYRFYRRTQKVGESIRDFVAELKSLSKICNFGVFLDSALRDAFVMGIAEARIQAKLLAEASLDFTRAQQIASSMETVKAEAHQISTPEVHKIQTNTERKCYRCGEPGHFAKQCPHLDKTCRNCGKKGHLAAVCRDPKRDKERGAKAEKRFRNAGKQKPSSKTCFVTESMENPRETLFSMSTRSMRSDPYMVQVTNYGIPGTMEIDTGSSSSLISKDEWKRLKSPILCKSDRQFETYTKEPVHVLGKITVKLTIHGTNQDAELLVVEHEGPSLLGRDLLKKFRLDWSRVFSISTKSSEEDILNQYPKLFQEEHKPPPIATVHLDLKPEAIPRFLRPRSLPYAVKEKVKEELDRLEADGVIKKVMHSKWATPLVVVPKPRGKVRICGDYKVTVNPQLLIDQHPLPKPNDLFATLNGSTKFSKLDLSQAYLQLELDEESRELTTVTTPWGLFQFTRLPYGIASAPAKFQAVMEKILCGLPTTQNYLDDILQGGKDEEDHKKNLQLLLKRLEDANVKLEADKCKFALDEVPFLGYVVSKAGLKKDPVKVEAIRQAPRPKDVKDVKSFLGLVQYYGKFVPNLSSVAEPLTKLTRNSEPWRWSRKEEASWQKLKNILSSDAVLSHYNPDLPLKLECDASPVGVGAVLTHVFPDGSERPVAYASKTLSKAERNYSQIDKEALALVFGVKRFHDYIYGRKFSLVTDHRPLLAILGPKAGIPPLAAARMQRWAVLMAAYDYDMRYRPSGSHGNADALSRNAIETEFPDAEAEMAKCCLIEAIENTELNFKTVQKGYTEDSLLQQVIKKMRNRWSQEDRKGVLQPFHSKRFELTWLS